MTDTAYSMVTTPRQLKASTHADALTHATLRITLSTDSLTPLPTPALAVAVPVGTGDQALAAAGTQVTAAAPNGWSTSTDDDQRVLFSPPPQAALDSTRPVTLIVGVEVNTRPGSGVVELTEVASGRAVQLPFRKASALEPLLKYELQPAIVNVTETRGSPLPTTFKLLITNHQTFTVELSCLVFAIPTGSLGTDLTEATVIDVAWPLGWRAGSTPLTFIPTSAAPLFSLAAGQTITFSFNQITVNKAVGTATLTVYECGKDQDFPACPSYDLDIAKFPPGADVGDVRLWIDPPPARPQGTKVTVHWKGPQGPTYHLYEDADLVGGGSVSNKGSHELTLVKSRWLTLDVAIAAGRDAAHATVQLRVKALKPTKPARASITDEPATSADALGAAETLTVTWTTANAIRSSIGIGGSVVPLDIAADGTVTCQLSSGDAKTLTVTQQGNMRGQLLLPPDAMVHQTVTVDVRAADAQWTASKAFNLRLMKPEFIEVLLQLVERTQSTGSPPPGTDLHLHWVLRHAFAYEISVDMPPPVNTLRWPRFECAANSDGTSRVTDKIGLVGTVQSVTMSVIAYGFGTTEHKQVVKH
jgi:hypothetical protein